MRGALRGHAARIERRILAHGFGAERNRAPVIVANVFNFLDVAVLYHFFNLRPFDFFCLDTTVAEQHPTDTDHQNEVKNPAEVNPDHTDLGTFIIIVLLLSHFNDIFAEQIYNKNDTKTKPRQYNMAGNGRIHE